MCNNVLDAGSFDQLVLNLLVQKFSEFYPNLDESEVNALVSNELQKYANQLAEMIVQSYVYENMSLEDDEYCDDCDDCECEDTDSENEDLEN